MAVVRSHERGSAFISRHFRHYEQEEQSEMKSKTGQATFDHLETVGECPGESDEHMTLKSIAYARLNHDFPDAAVELESGVDGRIADVLLTFDEPRAPYGKGFAVEAQYEITERILRVSRSTTWNENTVLRGLKKLICPNTTLISLGC